MTVQNELSTITSSLEELAARLTALVELDEGKGDSDVYVELVAAERAVTTLLRRLNRVSRAIR